VHFEHVADIWADFPQLTAGVLRVDGITPDADVDALVTDHLAAARLRLAGGTEADLPEVQAWRRAFSAMGLKPTQYRCASEALLRQLRKGGALPRLHPLVDLCNAASAAWAIPVAAFDLTRISGNLQVRRATGTERYATFTGNEEHPKPGEVVFADEAGEAHARRWANRQSASSAVRETTSTALIVTEALHGSAARDVDGLVRTLARQISATWPTTPPSGPASAVLTANSSRFTT
jgi:DNA/RNA-binding domain of Phe-tRNA-synthetase-like protein